MAIRTVYNRDGSVYGELNTDDFLFNNDAIGSDPVKLDTKIYPYVKIDGEYYHNDGGEWFTRSKSGNAGSMMRTTSSYLVESSNYLPNSISLVSAVKNYTSSDSTWKTYNDKEYSIANDYYTYAYTIPNYQITGSSIRGISFENRFKTDNYYQYDKALTTPNGSSTTWNKFAFSEHGYFLAFNNFGATFSKGSLASKNLTVEVSNNQIKLTRDGTTKTVTLASGDIVYLLARAPGEISYTGRYQWLLSEYAGRMLSISWVPSSWTEGFPTNSSEQAMHTYSLENTCGVQTIKLNNGTYIFKGESVSVNGTNATFDEDWIYTNAISTPTEISNLLQGVVETYDEGLYIPDDYSCDTSDYGWMSASVYIKLRSTTPYAEPDMHSSGTLKPEHTRFSLDVDYQYFKNGAINIEETLNPYNPFSVRFYDGDDDRMIAAYYPKHRYKINSVGVVKTGFVPEPCVCWQYPVISPPKKTTNTSKKPNLTISTCGQTYSKLTATYETSYFSLLEMWATDKVKMGIQAGTFVNVSTSANDDGSLTNLSGYTNEPAIAILIKSSKEITTNFSSFMLDEK